MLFALAGNVLCARTLGPVGVAGSMVLFRPVVTVCRKVIGADDEMFTKML